MAKFKARLKADSGGHREGTGPDAKDYKPGDVVESHIDLIKAFPGKFEDPNAGGPSEEDVTDQFDAAAENDLKVIKRSGKWYVCGPGGTGTEKSGALNKGKVEDFIYNYLESLEDGDGEGEDDDDEEDDTGDDGDGEE